MQMVLQRIDPFREFKKLDEVISRAWQGDGDGHFERRWAIPVDLTQDGDDVVLRATVPGVAPEDIDVTIEDGVLTISAETPQNGDDSYIIRERRVGKLYRALRLPNTLDVGKAETEYRHGVLTLTFPKVEAVKARRLEIKGA
ncbi:MAG: Hsp20/alpha crystallin family protein [Chloroflexi bacterium]|nr:Hsp20/alpha crystallin family protein [Chloroflexota bacterium]